MEIGHGQEFGLRLLLGATSFLAITTLDPAARATPIDFTFTGSLVTFTVPTTDNYQILAFGAQGGNAVFNLTTGAPAVWEQRSEATLLSRQERPCRLPLVALVPIATFKLRN
jgi:hypothetical protein